jgi:arginine decarboxylase
MKKFDLSSWPVLIVSGQVHQENDEGSRLREIIDSLETQQGCSVIISLTYHDADDVFQSRTDPGAVLVDWDISGGLKTAMTEKMSRDGSIKKMSGDDLIENIRKRNKTIPILLLTERLTIEKIPVKVLKKINGYLWKTGDTPDYLAGRIRMHVSGYAANVLPVFFGKLIDYVNEYKYAWHTPGHMGGEGFLRSPAGVAFYKFFGEDVMRADLSVSVPELGSLLDHSGVTGDAEKFSAKVFGSDQTYYVLNGTSTANQIIWRSQVSQGDIALVDRNCHKSLNYAMVITNACPIYLKPRRNGLGIIGPVKLDEFSDKSIKKEIDKSPLIPKNKKIEVLVKMSALTNSTYDGVCYNVATIIEQLQKSGATNRVENLHFDEAWYAYARFHPIYKNHFGMADPVGNLFGAYRQPIFCSQSTHKLLTAFSQASMIHIKNGWDGSQTVLEIDHDMFNESYMMHGSTSPQYNMIASLDVATKMMFDNGEIILNDIIVEAIELRKKMVTIAKGLQEKKNDQENGKDWFFGMWQPGRVNIENESKMKNFEDVKTEYLASHQEVWIMTNKDNWHGFDLAKDNSEDNYVMLDPIKLTFTCPGFDVKEKKYTKFGIPAAVVTNYLIDKGIVCEKTDYYSWLMLNSLGTTKGKQGTLLAELFKFKELYDTNAPLADVFPALVQQYPEKYKNKGLKDHCRDIHAFFSEKDILGKMKNAFDAIPDQKMTPAKAFQKVVKKNVKYVVLKKIKGRTPAVMIVPYPPGIPIMMGGEQINKEIIDYLTLRQDFENQFPGYESTIHGVERIPDTKRKGQNLFQILCVNK